MEYYKRFPGHPRSRLAPCCAGAAFWFSRLSLPFLPFFFITQIPKHLQLSHPCRRCASVVFSLSTCPTPRAPDRSLFFFHSSSPESPLRRRRLSTLLRQQSVPIPRSRSYLVPGLPVFFPPVFFCPRTDALLITFVS